MPNIINDLGLQVKTRDELRTELVNSLKAIYGNDINVDSDTPDGQLINIFVQSVVDLEDLLVQINNSFDPDNAIGVILDQRVAINGIQRQAGTYTVTEITIVTNQSLNLYGLDQDTQPVYTVADNAGNEWLLTSSISIPGAGPQPLTFRAAVPGARLTTPNTINVPVSIVLGVTSINNPTSYQTLGIDEESDYDLKIRRQRSVSLASQGYLAGLLAALENINGIISAFVYENRTSAPDLDGVPGHSIWVIVSGTADDADIAQAIYTKRNAGCGMYGDKSYVITQKDGSPFTVYWSEVVTEVLYIKFTATSLNGIQPPNVAAIRLGLPNSFVPRVNEQVNINDLATAVQEIDNNTLVTIAGFSTNPTGPFDPVLSPSTKNRQFVISSPNIIIVPMIMSPQTAQVITTEDKQFFAYGGFGAYTWTLQQDESGASIDSSTGVYTAGITTPATDIVRATDAQGNYIEAQITVV